MGIEAAEKNRSIFSRLGRNKFLRGPLAAAALAAATPAFAETAPEPLHHWEHFGAAPFINTKNMNSDAAWKLAFSEPMIQKAARLSGQKEGWSQAEHDAFIVAMRAAKDNAEIRPVPKGTVLNSMLTEHGVQGKTEVDIEGGVNAVKIKFDYTNDGILHHVVYDDPLGCWNGGSESDTPELPPPPKDIPPPPPKYELHREGIWCFDGKNWTKNPIGYVLGDANTGYALPRESAFIAKDANGAVEEVVTKSGLRAEGIIEQDVRLDPVAAPRVVETYLSEVPLGIKVDVPGGGEIDFFKTPLRYQNYGIGEQKGVLQEIAVLRVFVDPMAGENAATRKLVEEKAREIMANPTYMTGVNVTESKTADIGPMQFTVRGGWHPYVIVEYITKTKVAP